MFVLQGGDPNFFNPTSSLKRGNRKLTLLEEANPAVNYYLFQRCLIALFCIMPCGYLDTYILIVVGRYESV